MFFKQGYRQVHPYDKHLREWDVLWCWRDPYFSSKHFKRLTSKMLRKGQLVNR